MDLDKMNEILEMPPEELACRTKELEVLYTQMVLIMIMKTTEHREGCDNPDCPAKKTPRELVEMCVANFRENLETNVRMNCEVNGFAFGKRPNEDLYKEILKEMEGEESG